MSKLTGQEIAVLVAKNGHFGPPLSDKTSAEFIDTAVAIALAESGGVTDRVSSTGDYGLFQINKAAHADVFTNHKWDNAASNVDMARIVWERAGKSFTPWVTYNSGAYQDYKGAVIPRKDAPNNPRKDAVNAAKKVAGAPLGMAKGVLDSVFTFIKESALVVGVFIAAIVFLILGFRALLQNSATYRKVEGHAVEAAKVAAVA